jgi:cobalamin biosynthetic protein CobC
LNSIARPGPDLGAFARHGGALDAAQRVFPLAPRPWIDLSTGINPVPYPIHDLACETWTRLPDATALAALEETAARRYRAPDTTRIVAAPGTQALIQALPDLRGGDDIRVLGPTYGEYERAYAGAGGRVRIVPTLETLAGADVAIVVNPNNPDGRLIAGEDLLAMARRVGMLVVDEAFADAMPTIYSLVPRLAGPPHSGTRIVVLRSFGKIYGLAGLRLGFAVSGADHADALRRRLGPWPVSGPAIAVGTQALADDAWLAATRTRLAEDGDRLLYLLGTIGAKPVGGTPLFKLVAHHAAPALFTELATHGILTRPFAVDATWLRFGLPATESAWDRLNDALRRFR